MGTEENQIPFNDNELCPEAKFCIGQLVKHKRYDYRGVVADYDMSCHADDAWYAANQSQPKRDQPWYHVLVHNGTHATYAAESSLEPDTDNTEIIHPVVQQIFTSFQNGMYFK